MEMGSVSLIWSNITMKFSYHIYFTFIWNRLIISYFYLVLIYWWMIRYIDFWKIIKVITKLPNSEQSYKDEAILLKHSWSNSLVRWRWNKSEYTLLEVEVWRLNSIRRAVGIIQFCMECVMVRLQSSLLS